MREIKFRAWDNTLKCWTNGHYPIGAHLSDTEFGYDTEKGRYTLMQYTGLKDKNGKEIYEGDVLEFTNKWEWYRGSYGIKMAFAKGKDLKDLQEKYQAEPMHRRVVEFNALEGYGLSKNDLEYYFEVIGNIYENPELLPANKPSDV